MDERKGLVRDLIRSEGWSIILEEVVKPYYESLGKALDSLTVDEVAQGPVIAGQRRAVTKILDDIDDYIHS